MFAAIASSGHWASALAMCLAAAPRPETSLAHDKQALAPLQAYVGHWRGVGMLKRGSSKGAWTELSEWSWQFKAGHAALVARITGGKYYQRFAVEPGAKSGQFVLVASHDTATRAAAATPDRFVGALADNRLVFLAEKPGDDTPARITVRLVAGGDRMVVLYEQRAGNETFARIAEVGSTRKGSSFAKNAASGHECIVTGGLGEIAVEHNGHTYYVCCTGCRDLFLADPAGVLADYKQRKAKQAAEKQE